MSKDDATNLLRNADLFSHIKMCKEIVTFGDVEIEKHKSYRYKSPIF